MPNGPRANIVREFALYLWLARRSGDARRMNDLRLDFHHEARKNWQDIGERGKGNKAWKRLEARIAARV